MRQFVPDQRERTRRPEEMSDPIGDGPHSPVHGIVHRYDNRVLLKIVAVCPVYCRFCFRREMIGPGQQGLLTDAELDGVVDYIASQPQVTEVIVTGGDPLILSPRRIKALTQRLAQIAHLTTLRWHSRVPVLQPHRITAEMERALTSSRLNVRMAIHCNHHLEITAQGRAALAQLRQSDIELLSQSVLLAGINDTVGALKRLIETFSENAIAAYYVHQLDLAPGTSHFRVPIQIGLRLLHCLRSQHPGLALPSYMLDLPGGYGKINIESDDVRLMQRRSDHDLYRVRDRHATWHRYRDFYNRGTSGEGVQPSSLEAVPSTIPVGRPLATENLT